jgi:N-acetylglucosamine-6-phosphate deacetylase
MEFHARRYDTSQAVRIRIADGVIAAIDPTAADESLPFVAPSLFDLQVNGYGGTWFSDQKLTVDLALEALHAYYAHGVTRLCPTLITNSTEALETGFRVIDEACRREQWADRMVAGCHLEGPFISPEDGPRGAHSARYVRPCDIAEFDRLQRASGYRIRLVTLAPEAPHAAEFTRAVVQRGIVVAIGHTAANTAQISDVVDAGARLSTHLGNGSHATLPRHPNYIWDQLGEPRLWASIITDGHHLPASVVRSIFFAKGASRTIITCDASGLAGSPPGVYDVAGGACEVLPDGRIVVAGQRQYLAGSGSLTDDCVGRMMKMTGLSAADAIRLASRNSAELLGFEVVELKRGSRADLILYDVQGENSPIKIRGTLADGVLMSGTLT